jgi:rhodanese-related sulfurtransferase
MKRHILSGFLALFALIAFSPAFTQAEPYLLTVQQLKGSMDRARQPNQKGFVLIDVRSPEEHQGGFIPGTDFNIDFRQIQNRHQELRSELDSHIVVYCQSGHRSNIAADMLMSLGYTNVYNVEGSMNAWEAAGYRIEHSR